MNNFVKFFLVTGQNIINQGQYLEEWKKSNFMRMITWVGSSTSDRFGMHCLFDATFDVALTCRYFKRLKTVTFYRLMRAKAAFFMVKQKQQEVHRIVDFTCVTSSRPCIRTRIVPPSG